MPLSIFLRSLLKKKTPANDLKTIKLISIVIIVGKTLIQKKTSNDMPMYIV